MADFWDSEHVLVDVRKNQTEKIIVRETTKGKKRFIDIRTYRVVEGGEYKYTAKGITVSEDHLKTIIESINESSIIREGF